MLININQLSQNRIKLLSADYKNHCKLLIEMKKDLDYIFKKIRNIKSKVESKYPEAYKMNLNVESEELKEEESEAIGYQQLESIKQVDSDAFEAVPES